MLRKDQRRRGKNRLSGARAMPLYLVIRSEKRLTSTTHSLPYLGAFSATSFISFYGHSLSPTLSCLSSLIYDGSLSLVSLIWFGYHSNFLCHLLLLSVAMSVLLLCGACNVPCGTVRAYKNHLRSNQHRANVGQSLQGYPCPGCHKLYSRSSEVKRHLDHDKCSGPRSQPIVETSHTLKHRLSVTSTDVTRKHQRTGSPNRADFNDLPQAPVLDRDSADEQHDSGTSADDSRSHTSNGVSAVADTQLLQDSSRSGYLPDEIIGLAVRDSYVYTMQTPEDARPRKSASRAATAEAATHIISEGTVDAMGYDIAESIVSLSVTEDVASFAHNARDSRKSSARKYAPTSRSHKTYTSSADTNSIGSLFGRSGVKVRLPGFMRSSQPSLLFRRQSSLLTNEMPAPMGERVDDELRWARRSPPPTEEAYRHRVYNGRKLIQDAAAGDYRSVYKTLLHLDVDINYDFKGGNAVWHACSKSHVKVLDAIVRAFTSTAFNKHLNVGLDMVSFRVTDQFGRLEFPTIGENKQDWEEFNSSVRVMIATVCCLCPKGLRPGTVCERVASGQLFSLDATKPECLWGDKLSQTTWPDLSQLLWRGAPRPFLESRGLNRIFLKSNEHVKTQAHKIYLRAAWPRTEYARLEESMLEIQKDMTNGALDREGWERYDSVAQELRRLRLDWNLIMEHIEDVRNTISWVEKYFAPIASRM
jgi:hypothetical protein